MTRRMFLSSNVQPLPPATYSQANRPLAVTTPLGKDALLLWNFTGHEGLSKLFRFHLDLIAPNGKAVPFEQLLGQPVTVSLELPGGKVRYFHGLVSRFSEGGRDQTFTRYKAEVV